MLKKIIIVLLIISLPMSVYLYTEYYRKPADLSAIQPVAILRATELIDEYEKDEVTANHRYLGKIIQVQGTIAEILKQQDTLANVMIGDTGSIRKVSCLLNKQHINLINHYKAGEQIIIKGLCSGFLMDVELNRCVIIEKE